MKKLLIALAFTGMIGSASAEKPSAESVNKLMKLTGAGEIGVQVIDQMLKSVKPLMPMAPEAFWQDFRKEANAEEMIKLVVPIYQKHLQQADVDAAIKFYETPEGQRLIKVQPAIMNEAFQVGQQWGQGLAKKLVKKYKDKYQKKSD